MKINDNGVLFKDKEICIGKILENFIYNKNLWFYFVDCCGYFKVNIIVVFIKKVIVSLYLLRYRMFIN